ncbi:(d)CMP kinase [Halanaerobium salsuginis]|jgi:cytidylate kinase|uniref:Cytidylate kinase n=1 Tax=Halanaerobium salsuginis TaxID=29563 RepID=A0A1I4EKT5_9FIRM|nr:(d)CMP kinase [Halanaerobium salsuginis]SFL06345.1 cytidylate kinase [Halanaerobium salsuginis]
MKNVVAIDGPGGAGKSTIARLLAEKLNYLHLDTGAMYRAVTLAALNKEIDFDNKTKLVELAKEIKIEFDLTGKVFLDGEDVSQEIRSEKVNEFVSKTAAVKGVREVLVKKQQQIAAVNKVVMDGRDITTVVLPDAEYKFFLTASLTERAKRRYEQLKKQNKEANLDEIKASIARRDKFDSEREHSPLTIADDAVVIDTTKLDIPNVISEILKIMSGDK